MIEPIKAPVRPRVFVDGESEAVLLEDLVSTALEKRCTSPIWVFGPNPDGITAALQHVLHQFGEDAGLSILDGFSDLEQFESQVPACIVVGDFTDAVDKPIRCRLAGWGRDEWIEYLLFAHRDQCASVMRRLVNDRIAPLLKEEAFLLRLVLDEMATDEELRDVEATLHRVVSCHFSDIEQRRAIARMNFFSMIGLRNSDGDLEQAAENNRTAIQRSLLRIPSIRLLTAADAAIEQLRLAHFHFDRMWPRDLLKAVALWITLSPMIQTTLQKWLRPGFRERQPLAATLLNAAGITPNWPKGRPIHQKIAGLNLKDAILDGAQCVRIPLARGSLVRASLERADLAQADLRGAIGIKACFAGTNLHRARMSSFDGTSGNFVGANLVEARGKYVNFAQTNFHNADLSQSRFRECDFTSANLVRAKFDGADLRYCCFHRAKLHRASFRDANLECADLRDLNLSVADFHHASFRAAYLKNCNLEEMRLPNANFCDAELDGALLTASVMPRAKFINASLRNTGLAEINWESADLRNANLIGATFHMGSSRSGLIDSTVPMYGSRTGFYTDEWNEQDFKAPEEIRKANLRGADIRGAVIDDVDFYLVDLRDALYDPEQEDQLQRTGAILAYRAC